MICIKANIPNDISEINDELKAIYHSKIVFVFGYLSLVKTEIDLWKKLLV